MLSRFWFSAVLHGIIGIPFQMKELKFTFTYALKYSGPLDVETSVAEELDLRPSRVVELDIVKVASWIEEVRVKQENLHIFVKQRDVSFCS